ncbi:hypothetical protein FHL15_003794 [Xylaria flabelliformis]|uniref:Uncharacterized protein n=1 Tax=Xylaria flabelliformis TaxID=2512241 RepID=A0A553I5J8_9PEZI|nr:hypothetical protein FHL15_003794 [Xylaria flabelliformis]
MNMTSTSSVMPVVRMFDPPASDHGRVAKMGEFGATVSSMEELRQYLLWGLVGDLQQKLTNSFHENMAPFQGHVLTPEVTQALAHRFQTSVRESLAASFDASVARKQERMAPYTAQSSHDPDPIPTWPPDASPHPNYDSRQDAVPYTREASQVAQYTRQLAVPDPSPSSSSTTPPAAGDANHERGWSVKCGARREYGDRVGLVVEPGDSQEQVWREWRAWTENAWKIKM